MKITFIQTGGTIDKDYPQGESHHGYDFKIGEPAFISILKTISPDFKYETIISLKKDSLDINDDDRKKLYQTIKSLKNDKVVITHGTDTIHLTAEKLSNIKDKVIVITGSMLPEKFCDSDAKFNLGMAVSAVEILDNGVYIALYGNIVPWNNFKQK